MAYSTVNTTVHRLGLATAQSLRIILASFLALVRAFVNSWQRPWADIGIVAGTTATRIVVPWKGQRVVEPSYMAVDPISDRVVAIGEEARSMEGRAPVPLTVLHPFRHGVVDNFEAATQFLKLLLKKEARGLRLAGPRVVVAVPSDATPLERLGIREVMFAAGARGVLLVDQSIASAVGAGVDLDIPRGSMMVHIGADTTQITVTALRGVVLNRCIRTGGRAMDHAICAFLKSHHHLWIGERTAEDLKRRLGTAIPLNPPIVAEIGGRDLCTGVPRKVEVTSNDICAVLVDILARIVEEVRQTVAGLTSEMIADILQQGIALTGGSSRLRGLDTLIRDQVHVPAVVATAPETRVARGVQRMLENKALLGAALVRESSRHAATVTSSETGPRRVNPFRAIIPVAAILALLALRPPVPQQVAATAADAPVEAVVAPILSRSLNAVRGVSTWFTSLWSGVADNQSLRDRVNLLETQLRESRRQVDVLRRHNAELDTILNLATDVPTVTIAAHILLRDPTGWLSTLLLDKGTHDGVEPQMAVTCTGGLIGQVVWTDSSSSRVRLITGRGVTVACNVRNRNAAGVLYGSGEETCELRFLDPDASMKPGDEVITSGLDKLYPPGIVVGRIAQIYPSHDTVSRSARVKPGAQLDSAAVVLLLPKRGK